MKQERERAGTLQRDSHVGGEDITGTVSKTATLTEGPAGKFLLALWGSGGDPGGKLGICSWKPGFSNSWFDISEDGIKSAAAKAIKLGVDVYFHCASHDESKSTGRGSNDTASMLPCVWADIDVAEAGKDNGKNYPSREFALELLEKLPVPPSCIIDSGNGLHAYWFLDEPVPAQDHTRLPGAFQDYLRSVFVDKETGEAYDIDSTGDLARVLRVPGTINSKGERVVSIIDLHDERRYEVGDLARWCPSTRSLPAESTEYSGIDIELEPDALPSDTKFNKLMEDLRFAKTWERSRDDLQDQSASSYDMSLSSQAARVGWTDQEIANLLIAHRREHGDDLKLHRLDYYQRTIAKAREGIDNGRDEVDALIEELNQTHAVIRYGQTQIMTKGYDPNLGRDTYDLESIQSFQHWHSNRKHGTRPIAKIWLEHKDRRQYKGMVFSPGQDFPGYLNLFQGFPITPVDGDCSLYLDLIRDVICNGNLAHHDYVIRWLAHMIQKPAELPGTALILRGKQGIGKGTMMKYLGELVGQHYLELTHMSQVTGKFNGHLKDALCLHANEAIWGGDKASEGQIKAMITDELTAIEQKGKDIITVRNYKRLILASNNPWPAPRDPDDRRFFVLDVSDAHKEDQEYFAAIHDQMSTDGLEALMHCLLNVDLDGFNPRVMPETDGAGFDMKLRSMDSVMQWLHEVLDDGDLPADRSNPLAVDHTWPEEYPKASLHALYGDWCRRQNQRHPESSALFGRKLKEVITGMRETRKAIAGRPRYYQLPPLQECRRLFEDACKEGPQIWSEGDGED